VDAKKFRMGEFEIFLYDSGELRWQSHCGLGECREGRCFRRGDILFLGPAQSSGPGFLKLEFLDRLGRLPAWTSTRYYTSCLDIYRCRTGKSVSVEELAYRKAPPDGECAETLIRSETPAPLFQAPSKHCSEGTNYRLENYEIAKGEDGDFVWYSYVGPSTLKSGICIVLEDILFLCPSQWRPAYHSKQRFRSNLRQLPRWDQTSYFCPKFPLRECARASKLRATTKDQVGDDSQPIAQVFERKGIKEFAGTVWPKRRVRGSFTNLSSHLRLPFNTAEKLSKCGALPRRVFNWLRAREKLALSCLRVIGSQALRLIFKLLSIALTILILLFTLIKTQYAWWSAKFKNSRLG